MFQPLKSMWDFKVIDPSDTAHQLLFLVVADQIDIYEQWAFFLSRWAFCDLLNFTDVDYHQQSPS